MEEGPQKTIDEGAGRLHNRGMQYRRFPRIEEAEVSTLGLGCMRLPVKGDDPGAVDEAALDAMLVAAAEAGVTYLDTAYPYHRGMGEAALGAALKRTGLGGRFTLATKSPVWLVKDSGDWERYLDEQLARLGTDHVEFYLFHALSHERWKTVKEFGGLAAFERFRRDGRIRHIGFSFHDSYRGFKEIVDDYPEWELCQIQYNYMDRDFQAGEAGLAYAAEREIGVVVMEPLRGGALANPPPAVRAVFNQYEKPRLPSEWALRFAMDRQEVVTVLSGMGSVKEIWENAAVADSARPNYLTKKEMAAYDEARKVFKSKEKVPCTTCGYCRPCPNGVQIQETFAYYNTAAMYDRKTDQAMFYASQVKSGGGADRCTHCGVCVKKCPQGIQIPERLKEAHAYLS